MLCWIVPWTCCHIGATRHTKHQCFFNEPFIWNTWFPRWISFNGTKQITIVVKCDGCPIFCSFALMFLLLFLLHFYHFNWQVLYVWWNLGCYCWLPFWLWLPFDFVDLDGRLFQINVNVLFNAVKKASDKHELSIVSFYSITRSLKLLSFSSVTMGSLSHSLARLNTSVSASSLFHRSCLFCSMLPSSKLHKLCLGLVWVDRWPELLVSGVATPMKWSLQMMDGLVSQS